MRAAELDGSVLNGGLGAGSSSAVGQLVITEVGDEPVDNGAILRGDYGLRALPRCYPQV